MRRTRKVEGVQPVQGRPGWYRLRGEYVDEKTGKRREIDRIAPAASPTEAASLRARLLDEESSKRAPRKVARERLGDALDRWLAGKVLAGSTRERYRCAIKAWQLPLADYYIDAIDPDDVRDVMLTGWRGTGDATETINGRLRVLRTFARDSRCGHIVEGVRALALSVEEVEADEDEGRGLDADELRRLLAAGPLAPMAAKRPPKKLPAWWPRAWALVATLAWTGLRFGEASALEWRDVDLDAGTLRVRRAQYRGVVGHPKARASKRTIALPEPLVELLREHRDAMVRGQLAGVESALVFPSRRKSAEHVSNTHARKTMLRACAAAKVGLGTRPALHSLRHALNNLVRQVATEEVRRSLIGHADEVETYTQVTRDEQRKAVGAVVRMIKGGG